MKLNPCLCLDDRLTDPYLGHCLDRSVSSGLFSPSSRESMDPIAELLSQLSGVRRATASDTTSSSAASQLQQLQIQLERQQVAGQPPSQVLRSFGALSLVVMMRSC